MTRILFNSIALRAVMAADDSQAAAANPAAVAKPKTVADDMDARRLFDTVEEAAAYLNLCSETFVDFDKIPVASVGLGLAEDNETLEFDPAVYLPGKMRVGISTLKATEAAKAGDKKTRAVKAIVIAPFPTREYLLEDKAGQDWVDRILAKELNHVAVRELRDAADVSTVTDRMPTTKTAYIESARASTGMTASFDALYKTINDIIGASVPMWKKAKLVKAELRKAMESKGYAEEYYPALEAPTEKRPGLFVMASQLGISAAKKEGLDPTIFERWLATRDQKVTAPTDEDEDELEFADLEAALNKAPAPATDAAPAQESAPAQ